MTMKSFISVLLFTLGAFAPWVNAAETPPPPPPRAMGAMMMSDEHLKEKQEHLLKMHELSNKILAATDAKEKERLKAEQLELMKAHEKRHVEMMQQHMQQQMMKPTGPPPAPPQRVPRSDWVNPFGATLKGSSADKSSPHHRRLDRLLRWSPPNDQY